ncbi:hypothetical protein HHI36_001175 [Cryptolaemus montrouzieri]|uniref:Uncharacterized protein n=1 Tax=Cryptolaemus montrouzieri TaxID=559131 RepID=A0ABD2P6T6_9CUCU
MKGGYDKDAHKECEFKLLPYFHRNPRFLNEASTSTMTDRTYPNLIQILILKIKINSYRTTRPQVVHNESYLSNESLDSDMQLVDDTARIRHTSMSVGGMPIKKHLE